MREFQPAGVLVAASTYATTDLLHSSNESEVRSPMSMDSQFSLLTAASSTLSLVSPTVPQCDWPEFQESYNSIMDNTNLLDSCAAALNDISTEDAMYSIRPEKVRNEFNRSLSSTTNSSFSGSDNATVTSKSVEQFTRWLCDMENCVAAQPKLLKIVTMKPKQRALQLELHSKIFKEIVGQPCIVKGTKYKSLEDRYHLLYLKVYEVLVLLEGLPANSFSPSNRILSESFHDYEYNSGTNSKEHSSDHVDSGDNEFLDDVNCDKTDSELKTPIYTETSVLSTSIGTYYFNYDDSIINNEQTTDNEAMAAKMSSTFFENSSDKEFTFEHDLHSLLNATDSLCVNSNDYTLVSEQRPLEVQQQLTDDTIVAVSQKNHIWNQIDFCELAATPPTSPQATNSRTKEYELSHHKVYDWLHTKTNNCKSKSTVSLNCSTASEADYQLLYRAKSEMDLSLCRPFDAHNNQCTSSLRTSLNCLPSMLSPVKCYESTLNDSIHEESSLIWDNFQLGNEFIKPDSDYGFAGSDFETKELINKLCYFGDDYSMHLNESITMESEKEAESSFDEKTTKPTVNVFETPPSSPVKVRRSRRLREKRLRSLNSINTADDSSSSESHSTLSLDQSSETNLSEATTATINSNMLSSTVVVDDSHHTATSHDKFTPEKTISYNSNDKQFELYTKESVEPKKMKINEMRPEDFHDIVKMCQSNIDCVITVLGADPNRILTVAYCQQMKYERYQKSNTETCKCKQPNTDATVDIKQQQQQQRTEDTQCNCNSHIVNNKSTDMCICAWVSHTIAMILNFLIDCWNVFRNMKLYTYLCRVTKALFGSTRYVADHLKSKQSILNAKAIKYS